MDTLNFEVLQEPCVFDIVQALAGFQRWITFTARLSVERKTLMRL